MDFTSVVFMILCAITTGLLGGFAIAALLSAFPVLIIPFAVLGGITIGYIIFGGEI